MSSTDPEGRHPGRAAPGGEAGGAEVARALREVMEHGVARPIPQGAFNELAIRAFRYQYGSNPVYRGFCDRRGVRPDSVVAWEEVPAVPTRAFKELVLLSGESSHPPTVFRTSGTTRGRDARGAHHVLDLGLYHHSLLSNFRDHLLPDGATLPFVSLVPHPRELPDSSLSHMVAVAADRFSGVGGGWFVDGEGHIARERLERTMESLEAEGRPALVLGTAFAFVHWLDALAAEERRFRLPPGSRAMETGGFKGRSREISREELHRRIEDRIGIPPGRVVNEYGMTELLSQLYEPILREPGGRPRRNVPPPWLRVRVVDPGTLEPVSPGSAGILMHFDLANLYSVCHILTEDMGVEVDGGVRVLGRAEGAEPRGCSLAMDDLLSAGAPRRRGARDDRGGSGQ